MPWGGGEVRFSAKWQSPVKAQLEVGNLCNEMMGVGGGSLIMASGCITAIGSSQQLPGKPLAYASSAELRGTYAEVLFDTAAHVGVIIEANDFRRRKKPKKIVSLPRLNLLNDDEYIVDDAVLKAMGLPEELIGSTELLMELADRQR